MLKLEGLESLCEENKAGLGQTQLIIYIIVGGAALMLMGISIYFVRRKTHKKTKR